MDKQIIITSKTTRDELLSQLISESKSAVSGIILVLESIPGFINTHVSLLVFNSMLKGYPKPIYWYSNHATIINFLKLSKILRIWKPPIDNHNTDPTNNGLHDDYNKTSNSTSSAHLYGDKNRIRGKVIHTTQTSNTVNNENNSTFSLPKNKLSAGISKIFTLKENPKENTEARDTTYKSNNEDISKDAVNNIDNVSSNLINDYNHVINESISSDNLTTQAQSTSLKTNPGQKNHAKYNSKYFNKLEKELDKIQPPDFTNLDDLIQKLESTKQVLETKQKKLSKSILDKEISFDLKSSPNWLVIFLIIFVIIVGIVYFMSKVR
jgi:hypothetical protein